MIIGLHSLRQPEIDLEKCNPHIQVAVAELRSRIKEESLRVVDWNDQYVGVAFIVSVHIPTRGPVKGVDIRKQEPILLLFHRTHYPNRAPLILSDRPDFPIERLAHLNPSLPGQPARLCLHRGSIDDWFAEHSLVSLIERAQSWLSDAASNRLIREQDRFEPTRVEIERRIGVAIYKPTMVEEYVRERWADRKGKGAAALLCRILGSASQDSLLRETPFSLRIDAICSLEEAAARFRRDHSEANKDADRVLIGLLVWPNQNQVCDEYFGHLPDTFATLSEFTVRLGLPLQDALDQYQAEKLQLLGGIPLVLAVQRPQLLIGSDSSMELLNLVLCPGEVHWPDVGRWKQEKPVFLLGNRVPLTSELARDLSALPTESQGDKVLLIGCGALGSKIGLHLARAGLTELTVVDSDDLSPHNLVRHGLLANSVGGNKAIELGKAVEAIYSDDAARVKVDAVQSNVLGILFGEQGQLLEQHTWLLDCSASASILGALIDPRLAQSPKMMRAEIADQGRMGFLMMEGPDRDPGLDDLQMALYDLAIDDERISRWLQQQRRDTERVVGPALEEITIGLGCSSVTMRMSDDMVSYHAAAAAMAVRGKITDQTSDVGIQISHCDRNANPRGGIEFVKVDKSLTLIPRQAHGWRVRLPQRLCTQLKNQMRLTAPCETGGLLVGFIHNKRRTIYVTRALDPPPDSKGYPYAFQFGVRDVPEVLERIGEQTGGLLGYVGEWHSHPQGPSRLSPKDKGAVRQISGHLKAAGLPTHIMVVTPKGCYPHLFHHR